jgi:FtsP/CotA-like multicopper oxidase with cupredoxin domain
LFIAISVTLLIFYTGYFFTDIGRGLKNEILRTEKQLSNNVGESENQLPIPPFLEDNNPDKNKAEFDLRVQYDKKEFILGYETDTLGYNGDYLGPIIRVNKGDEVKINISNSLDVPTTVKWHGLEVPGEMDGGPHQVLDPNTPWEPYFTIDQAAATLWYHRHLLHKTGEQVYKGLAGLIYIEDDDSRELNTPKEHGINDFPLVIQDKRFTNDDQIPYDLSMRDLMNGILGETVLFNGAINLELNIKIEVIRFRLLNGSNARTYTFNFGNNTEFFKLHQMVDF